MSEQQHGPAELQEQLLARVGETVALYGRSDYVVVAVHSKEAKIEAPKTRKHPESVKYPKLRTLATAFEPKVEQSAEAVS